MRFVPYRKLRNNTPSTLRKKFTNEGGLVLTVGNKSFAVMIGLGDENVQDMLFRISFLRAQMAVRSIRSQAHKDGLNKMTLKEINILIKEIRREQKRYPDG